MGRNAMTFLGGSNVLRAVQSRIALCTVLVGLLLALCWTASAFAFSNSWSCARYAGNHCTDPDTSYHSWIETVSGTTGATYVQSLCIKAKTEAGNIRSTTAGNWCGSNTTVVGRCLTASTPTSRAYSYWESGSGQVTMSNGAFTPSESFC